MAEGVPFEKQVSGFSTRTIAALDRTQRAVALKLFSAVIGNTPVDTGRLAANWRFSMAGKPDRTVSDEGGGAAARHKKVGELTQFLIAVPAVPKDGKRVLTMSNSLQYAWKVEFGGYPNPPKRGSFIDGKWVQKSSGGFSKQAPQGMVRLNVQRIQAIVSKAVEEERARITKGGA